MRNQYHHTKIEKIIDHSEYMKSFVFDFSFKDSKAGQFVMIWLPGIDEKPISLSAHNMITVRKIGPFTNKLFEKKEGDCLDIRGPYGKGFPDSGNNIIIGGGCGIAPLVHFVMRNNPNIDCFVLAGKIKSDIIFLDEIKNKVKDVVSVTEDGSYGIKGLATDADIPKTDGNYCICGPEIMIKKTAEKLINEGINPSKIYISMERYMKCAIGICGNCSFSGYRVCADGPVFRYDKIKDLPHFNKYERSRTGELIPKNK